MDHPTLVYVLWAVALGAVSAASLPLGSLVGLRVRFPPFIIAIMAAFGAGALIAALSVELVAPTAMALTEPANGAEAGHARLNFFALLVGGVVGGLLFVALDAAVNQKGGYIRKTATMLAHVAARRREEVRKMMRHVLALPPFDALPAELGPTLAGMLRPVAFKQGAVVSSPEQLTSEGYIVLDGEFDIEIDGKHAASFGPGAVLGVLTLFIPEIESRATVKAKTAAQCLALERDDAEHLKELSPEFEQALKNLAGERLDQLEHHVAARLEEAREWARQAAGAMRLGSEVPALAIRRAHAEHHGSPLAVWLGILLDGIPESLVIGAGLFGFLLAHPAAESLRFVQVIPYTLVAGLFLSNFPEALSSSANMLAGGMPRRRIFLMWFALMVTTALGAGLGYLLAGVLSETWLAFAEGIAAGAMLTMIAAAMIPEAAAHGKPSAVGLSTLAGFLAAVLFKLLE
jgi:zinc transporter ZupT/CRP-like cAMP-binding protein